MGSTRLSRRTFINRAAEGAAGLWALSRSERACSDGAGAAAGKVPVVVVKDETVIEDSAINQGVVQVMLDRAMRSLAGDETAGKAWLSLFPGITRNSIVCIKVNCINSLLSSHPEVAYSIVNGLVGMEVDGSPFPAENIIIWDRTNGELKSAGYSINTGSTGVKCFGTNQSGVGYASTMYDVAGASERLSSILTDISDYMINLFLLKNHGTTGLTLSMKNHYGTCSDPGSLHGGYGNSYIPALNSLPSIINKQVITICDGLFGIISGGPGGSPQIQPNSLVISKDPVANDTVCAGILQENGCRTISYARHIATAAGEPYSLGTNNPDNIDVITIENPTTVSVEDSNDLAAPQSFRLYQNYPNPFNAMTTIAYQLYKPAHVELAIYTVQGTLVSRLIDGRQSTGYYRIAWNGATSRGLHISSGMYLCRMLLGAERSVIRMQYVK